MLRNFVRNYSSGKVFTDAKKALEGIGPGITLLSGGFGLSGVPDTLINALADIPSICNITAVSNNAGTHGKGLSKLLSSSQISKMISSYIGGNKTFEQMYLTGKVRVELIPQGNLAERCRAGGAGVPAFYTPAGVGTWLESGHLPVLYDSEGNVVEMNQPPETRYFGEKKYLLQEAIVGDVAFIKAYKADSLGNCWFKGSSRNFNSVMARAAKLTIVEAEHIVDPGDIKPEDVHLPAVYVDRIVKSVTPKEIELLKLQSDRTEITPGRQRIIERAAKEVKDGMTVNLGIGLPTLIPEQLTSVKATLQSENGILGLGPYPVEGQQDPDMINAGKETVTLNTGASLFGSEESFAMIRSGKIDLTILGALQVSQHGDLANWGLPGKIKGMGGAMDLVANPLQTKVIVVMDHTDRKGRPKIVESCTFPLTGARCVSKIITDLAVFEVGSDGLTLVEVTEGISLQDIRDRTTAPFKVLQSLLSTT